MNDERWQGLLLVVLMLVIGVIAGARPASGGVPQRIPCSQVEAWMADCLPGVGPKTRDKIADELRHGRWGDIPARAQVQAHQWFAEDD